MNTEEDTVLDAAENGARHEERLFDHHQASMYRTRWLAAHNRLCDLMHNPDADREALWHAYVTELQSSGDMSETQRAA